MTKSTASQFRARAIRALKTNVVQNGDCLIWGGRVNEKGYGQIYWDGYFFMSHRLSYTYFVGPIPVGMLACHKCDTPSCVNPEHIFLGSPKENTHDAVKKGRMAINRNGGKPPAFDELTMGEMLAYKQLGASDKKIAEIFGFSEDCVRYWKKRKFIYPAKWRTGKQ